MAYLEAFDEATKKAGAARNLFKAEVICSANPTKIVQNEASWSFKRMRELAAVSDAAHPGLTLGGH